MSLFLEGDCERPDCGRIGTYYQRYGRTVHIGGEGINYSSTATVLPEPMSLLCQEHALESYGVGMIIEEPSCSPD